MSTDSPDMLPGLDAITAPDPGQSRLEAAVIQQLVAMAQTGDIELTRDAGLVMLATELAKAVHAGTRSGRASAVAMAARELRETLMALRPEDGPAGGDEEWKAFQELLRKAGAME